LKIKVVITDDHPIVTQGFKHFLSTEPDIEVSATFSDGKSLLKWLSDNTTDILLLDIYLQDSNGLELCKKISEEYPDIGIIAIRGQDEGIVISQMFQNGALGYVLKNAECEENIEGI